VAKWSELKQALEQWNEARIQAAVEQQSLHATKLKDDIVKELNRPGSRTAIKKNPLSPMEQQKDTKNPLDGLDQYASSVIMEDEGDGLKSTHIVKIDDPMKKDKTTEMEIGKIAKAVEFGTRQVAPRPAWRRALNKMKAMGIYKKDS
jgi:hypothetical protein